MKKNFSVVFMVFIFFIMVLLVFFSGLVTGNEDKTYYFEKAKILKINEEVIQEDSVLPGTFLGYQQLQVEVLTGKFKGQVYHIKNSLSRLYNVHGKEDMNLILRIVVKDDAVQNVAIFNYKRDRILYVLVALFFLLLIVFGKMSGVKSIISLIFTAVMVVFFLLPLIFKGYDPVPMAILVVSITTVVTLVLVGGLNKKTATAILGTIIGVIIAGIISYIAGNLANLSGITMNEAEELIFIAGDRGVKVKGLMFTGILIASLGAIMDVAMSIASSIFEIHKNNPKLSSRELYSSGMNVGRDVMGTMSNTLILAFAGGSFNIMILIMAYRMPYNQLINLDLVGTELIQGLAGSIGIVLTVPITALVASVLSKTEESRISEKA